MADNSIVNLGELTKPATVLVEKISDAVGGIFKPYQVVRIAKAEAEAERIHAESQIQVSDIQRRAMHRFLEEEAKKQKNIESITQQALPYVGDKATPQNIEDDWISNFFDKCKLISDSEMQSLWSRILSGEANGPGTYSKRTVNFLSSLDKSDADLFSKLCKFGWWIGDIVPLIYDVQNEIYNNYGIDFSSLSHLDSIGLIKFENMSGFRKLGVPQKFAPTYYGTPVRLDFPKESDNEISVGKVLLTKTGQELAPICGSSPDVNFLEYIKGKWRQMGLIKEKMIDPPN